MSVSCSCARPWRQPSLLATAHRVRFSVDGLRAWPIDDCSNKDAGKRDRETPTL